MKRFFCMLLSALLVLSLCPASFAVSDEAAQSVALSLECNPSTGYEWLAFTSDETVAFAEDLGIEEDQEDSDLLGAPGTHSFRIVGAAPGEAEISFSYSRSWENVQPQCRFTLPVTVDEGLNVITGSEIILFREEDTGWAFEMQEGSILEIEDQGGDESDQRFTLRPLAEGTEEITFTLFSGEGQLPGVFTFQLTVQGEQISAREIRYRSEESSGFSPAFQFATTDLEGGEVTEGIFEGHTLTVLNFWEPWCGSCVAEMPFLEQLSQEYADKGVQVIGVFATPDADEDVQAVLDSTGVTYPILRYVKEFGFMQTGYVPTTAIVDGNGAIVYGPFAGAMNYAGWSALIEELL